MMHIINFGTEKSFRKNSYMRKLEIEIPDGKMAKWVNGVLTLVDEKPQYVMERIKTFEDAVAELSNRAMNGDKDAGELLDEWKISSQVGSKDLLAYLKLRIITYALNEGWKPQFTNGESRWYFWYTLITKEQYSELSAEKKSRVIGRGGSSANAYYGLFYASANSASSHSYAGYGSRLAFKNKVLAEYAGKQFVEIYEEYCLI